MTTGFSSVSYLDAIRPDPGWETDLALVTSYSSDVVVMVAVMLALAGLDDERGSGSKVDFASAHEKLSGRLRFLVQAGRISAPKVKPAVLAVMDQFIQEVRANEEEGSWHPKVALVRYVRATDKAVQWRLWMGSRNLTRDYSFDIGFTLVTGDSGTGAKVAGIEHLGRTLAEMSQISRYKPHAIQRELADARWSLPAGMLVRSVDFRPGGRQRTLPEAPADLEELLVISPFLDGGTVRTLGSWGGTATKRYLLSTRSELSKVRAQVNKPASGFDELLYMETPELSIAATTPSAESDEAEEEELHRGLHAKIIAAKQSDGALVWLGSANATRRGWRGANTEVIAEAKVDERFYGHLQAFTKDAIPLHDDQKLEIEEDPREEVLERIRKTISAKANLQLNIQDGIPILSSSEPLNPDEKEVRVFVGLLTSQLVEWPFSAKSLPLPPIAAYQITELVVVRLTLEDLEVEWIQKAELMGGIPTDRDRRTLAHHLSPRIFLEWIRSLLHPGMDIEGGGAWDDESQRSATRRVLPSSASAAWWAPSLEEVLKAWSRDPKTLEDVDRKLKAYVRYLEDQVKEGPDKVELEALQRFKETWAIIRPELLSGKEHG